MPEVKCTVSNCEYWGEENRCTADQILISAGPTPGKPPHGEHAARLGHTPAQVAQATYCWTFTARPQGLQAEIEYEEEVEATMTVPPLI
ncbi:MAG TPA: DUF1540 domain-containing protein [Armatimonadota bacterium]|nr:DUF1540 domain-containing protein [Armatimonadota bacterium]